MTDPRRYNVEVRDAGIWWAEATYWTPDEADEHACAKREIVGCDNVRVRAWKATS